MVCQRPIRRRDALKPLGSHTSVGFLHELKKWKDIPYLKENEGMLPPFIIAVGSRVRVMKAKECLGLHNPVFIDQHALEHVGLGAYGRVSMLAGIYDRDGHPFPLLVVETQMGCPTTQIIMKEVLYHSREDGYSFDYGSKARGSVKSDGIYVVRAGTAAGVNSLKPSEWMANIGDVLIANESYGSIGAVIQSHMNRLHFAGDFAFTPKGMIDDVRMDDDGSICMVEAKGPGYGIGGAGEETIELLEKLAELGLNRVVSWSHDKKTLKTNSSPRMVMQLQRAVSQLNLEGIVGANFSKDSLYAEMGEEEFAWLRDNYGVVSTEMEQVMIDALAGEFRMAGVPVHTGLVSAAIGAIPGKSFPETENEKKDAANAENKALNVAAKGLSNVVRALNS